MKESFEEMAARSLDHLTQTEIVMDEKNPKETALVGIGYAILALAAAMKGNKR